MIEITDLVKEFRPARPGRVEPVRALDGVSLTIPAGSALAIVGLNGAGKSTLLRVLLGYARPTSGEVRIHGFAPRAFAEREGVAYVPEKVTVPGHWRVRGALRAYAMLGGLGDDAWDRVESALRRLGLESLAERRVGTLSKGNLQRLAIGQALLGDRRVMVLDEPTDGLDPVWIAELRDIIREWRSARGDRIVVLASHNLPEVERIAERVILLHNGRAEGDLPPASAGRSLEDGFLDRLRELGEPRP
jgi:ABC-2 type transport system ATP-binding protein